MGRKSKHREVTVTIIENIKNGTYPPGSTIPTLDEMVEAYQLSRMTVQKALNTLKAKGFISSCRGKRSRVIARTPADHNHHNVVKKHICILSHFDVDTGDSLTTPLQIVNSLLTNLSSVGNYISCLQYTKNLDLHVESNDAYIMVDMLGYRSQCKDLLKQTGKPYVVIECLKSNGMEPNHIHLAYSTAFMRLVNYFLHRKMKSFVFVTVDAKTVAKFQDQKDFDETTERMIENFLKPFIDSLEFHGHGSDNLKVLYANYKSETSVQLTQDLLRGNIEKGVVFMVISENSALGVYQTLTENGWKYEEDFLIIVFDPIKRLLKLIPNILFLKINQEDLSRNVIKSLNYQFRNNVSSCPGDIVEAAFYSSGDLLSLRE